MQEKILTPEQVAEIIQVHPFTILKYIKQGKLVASKIGRVYRIRQSDLEEFLDRTSGKSSRAENNVGNNKNKNKTTLNNHPAHATDFEQSEPSQNKTQTTEIPTQTDSVVQAKVVEEGQTSQKLGGEDVYYILR